MSPTQRTIRELKNRGLKCGIVEKFNRFAGPHGIRQDLFGIIDIIALDPLRGVVGVQSTGQDFSGHMRKLKEERLQECIDWLSTPGTVLELWGWRKLKAKRGGKAMVWRPRIEVLTLKFFQNEIEQPDQPQKQIHVPKEMDLLMSSTHQSHHTNQN